MQRHERFAGTGVAGVRGEALCTGTHPELGVEVLGAPGDEQVTSLVGMGAVKEGFGLKLEEVPLTAEPKQYTIGESRVSDGKVVGGVAVTPLTASARQNGA